MEGRREQWPSQLRPLEALAGEREHDVGCPSRSVAHSPAILKQLSKWTTERKYQRNCRSLRSEYGSARGDPPIEATLPNISQHLACLLMGSMVKRRGDARRSLLDRRGDDQGLCSFARSGGSQRARVLNA